MWLNHLDNDDVNELNNPANQNDVSYNFNDAFLGLHYKILTWKFTFTPGVSIYDYSMINQQLGQILAKISPGFYLEVGYNIVINDYANSVYYADRPFAKLDYYFLDSFSLVTEYEFYHYCNTEKSVEYKISGTNLLNTKSINEDSFSQFSTRITQFTVQPRYLILSLKYNI